MENSIKEARREPNRRYGDFVGMKGQQASQVGDDEWKADCLHRGLGRYKGDNLNDTGNRLSECECGPCLRQTLHLLV
eukprot:10452_5